MVRIERKKLGGYFARNPPIKARNYQTKVLVSEGNLYCGYSKTPNEWDGIHEGSPPDLLAGSTSLRTWVETHPDDELIGVRLASNLI